MHQFKLIQAFRLKDASTRGGTAGNNTDFIIGSALQGKSYSSLMRKTEAVLIQEADLGEVQAEAVFGKLTSSWTQPFPAQCQVYTMA